MSPPPLRDAETTEQTQRRTLGRVRLEHLVICLNQRTMTAFDLIRRVGEAPASKRPSTGGWRTHGCRRDIGVSDEALHHGDVDPGVEEVRHTGRAQVVG